MIFAVRVRFQTDRTHETAPAGGGTNPAESGELLGPLLVRRKSPYPDEIIILKILLDI